MIIYLEHDCLLQISGPGATDLLQGQLTVDVKSVTSSASLAAMCNREGRVISLFYLFKIDDVFYLLMQKSMLAITKKSLSKFAPFYKVTIDEMNETTQCFILINETITHVDQGLLIPFHHNETTHLVIIHNTTHATTTATHRDDVWHLMNIHNKLATIYPETSALFLPQELELFSHSAVSLQKGCYTGQEIIARMYYRGKTKYHLQVATGSFPNTIKRGDSLLNETGKPCGQLVDFIQTTENTATMLLLIPIEHPATIFLDKDLLYNINLNDG